MEAASVMAYDSWMLAAGSIWRTLLSTPSVGVPPPTSTRFTCEKARRWLLPAASHSATNIAGTAMKLLTCNHQLCIKLKRCTTFVRCLATSFDTQAVRVHGVGSTHLVTIQVVNHSGGAETRGEDVPSSSHQHRKQRGQPTCGRGMNRPNHARRPIQRPTAAIHCRIDVCVSVGNKMHTHMAQRRSMVADRQQLDKRLHVEGSVRQHLQRAGEFALLFAHRTTCFLHPYGCSAQ